MLNLLKKIIKNRRGRKYEEINPDEIFLDSKNLPDFDTYQFEGRLEKSISPKVFLFFPLVCIIIFSVFLYRLWSLQIVFGEEYRERSENNKLRQTLIVAPRGMIISRNGERLAWNQKTENEKDFPDRIYIDKKGFSNLIGFIKYPAKDSAGFYHTEEFLPKDGMEVYLNEILAGSNGVELIETSVLGDILSQNVVKKPKSGENVILSIDSRIQNKLYEIIEELAQRVNFQGGAGVIMDIDSGEILSIVSYPEYNSSVMTEGKDIERINYYFENPNNPFLNRVLSGLYTPGSIIKPFMAFAALEENIISPDKEIVSTGRLVVPNPYNPDNPTIFRDWKAHGATNMREAIAVSSDVYFYQIGGGFEGQKGLGISNINKYMKIFGFAQKTGFYNEKEAVGVIPSPEWKEKMFDGEVWRIGDTYNTSIGQYGMQISPIQAVVATASIANNGHLITPSIIFTSTSTITKGTIIKGSQESFKIAKEGMRMAVTEGTAGGLNVPYVEVAAKTGTAELGAQKQFVNSWIIGFFPYEKPKYAFTVVMERGPVANLTGGVYVMRQLLDWMNINTPEYFE